MNKLRWYCLPKAIPDFRVFSSLIGSVSIVLEDVNKSG